LHMHKNTNLKEGEKAALTSLFITFGLVVVKGLVGTISGIIVLISDALHSTADLTIDLASLVGIKISQKKPTEKFPYGYYKAENIATLFISLFILYVAVQLIIESYFSLFSFTTVSMTNIALLVSIFSSLISYLIGSYLKKIGKLTNLSSLVVNGKERIIDSISSMFVFLAILSIIFKISYVANIVTIAISILILRIGIFSLKDSILSLMDISPSQGIVKEIEEIIKGEKDVISYENLKLRKSGPFLFGEVIIKVKKGFDITKAHEISDKIERKIKERIRQINSFLIHVEPFEARKIKIAVPIKEKNGLKSLVDEKFGRAPFFLFLTVDREQKRIIETYIRENPYKDAKIRAGKLTSQFLVKEEIDYVIAKEIGEISFSFLKSNSIEVLITDTDTVEEAVLKYLNNELKSIEKATRKV